MNFWDPYRQPHVWLSVHLVYGHFGRFYAQPNDDHVSHFMVFPDGLDHLGRVQTQRHQGVGQHQGHPQKRFFWKFYPNKS